MENIEDKKAELAQRRKGQILAAAKHIFAQNGFRRTKIEQIAAHLTIGKGTIYRYFNNKKSLFLAVFKQGMNQLRQAIRANVEPITTPPERVAAAVRTYFEFFDNDRELIEILMQVRSEFKDDYRRIFLAVYGDYIVKIQENLRKGIGTGIFRNLDVEKTADAISATLQGVLQSFYVREFGQETPAAAGAEKQLPADSALLRANKTTRQGESSTKRDSLTSRTEAVTALLLEGLLKAEQRKKTSE